MNSKKISLPILLCGCLVLMGACDLAQNSLKSDREGNMERQDYRDALASRVQFEDETATQNASIPSLQPYIASSNQTMKTMPLVSLSVNQSVPLRDILFELAKQADYDLELDPRITGSIIFTARQKPFDQVVARISDVAGLRYNFDEDDVLRIELDTPYNKLYKIDYLSFVRTTSGKISNNVSVVKGDDADTGSDFNASSTSEIDFWAEVETNLQQLLQGASTGALKTNTNPRISAAPEIPNVQTVAPTNESNDGFTPPDAVLNVESLPVDDIANVEAANLQSSEASFTINKQAGIVSVTASQSLHKEVENYLKVLEKSVTAQVLIEAKILQVELLDEHSTGIDWQSLDLLSGELALDFTSPISTSSNSLFTAVYSGNDVQTVIQALSAFGTVKALASPRLTVLNNQSAVMNVANNVVYFELEIDVTDEDQDNGDEERRIEITSEIQSVPEGVLVNVQPSINLDQQTISMALRPTITRIDDRINNPGLDFIIALNNLDPALSASAQVPQLNVQEIDSIIKVRSGQPIIMGGLLQDIVTSDEAGVPILSETPMIGGLFKNHSDTVSKKELVIFLKATIINDAPDTIHATDKDLYRRFSSDRRPFRL